MAKERKNSYTLLLTIATASFLMTFMASSVTIALPSIGKDFKCDAVLLGWIVTVYLLSVASFLVPLGRIADIKGKRKIFLTGLFVYTLASGLAAASPSATLLVFSRVIQGTGAAMIFSTAVAILTSAFPSTEIGKIFGINTAAVYAGLSFGPVFGGFLTQNFGWRSIFLLNVPIGAFIALLVGLKLKEEWIEAKEEKFDLVGSIIYGLALVFIVYGASTLELIFALFGLLCLTFFIYWESKVNDPILETKLFKENITFSFSNAATFLNYSSTFAVGFLLSLYLQYIKNLTPQDTGIILMVQPVIQSILSPIAGWLSDKIEPRTVASAGMCTIAFSLLNFSKVNENSPLSIIILNLMLLGIGFALFSSPNTNAVMSSVKRKFYGVASAILATMRLTGQMVSMVLVMIVFSVYIGNAKIAEAKTHFIVSMGVLFILLSMICFIGTCFSIARGKIR